MELPAVRSPPVVKLTSACGNCRDRKVKCSGGHPCKTCHRQQTTCIYPVSRRGKRARTGSMSKPDIWPNRIKPTSCNGGVSQLNAILPPTPSYTTSDIYEEERGEPMSASTDVISPTNMLHVRGSSKLPNFSPGTPTRDINTRSLAHDQHDTDESVIPLHRVYWEHHGPCSWASVCTQPGIKWISNRMGTDEYVEVAYNLARTWSRRLKMKRFKSLKTQYPEPDEAAAWTYVTAYFEESYDAVFGTVHRPSFESRLRAHFARPNSIQSDDASWFALRNTVYAAGCRALLSKNNSASFVAANTKSHQFFMNAMSVFGEMLFGRSGFTALQAIVLMGFYAEGLGSPALEYPLASNAVQLALARGLHRAPARSWNLPEADVLTRNWLWWAVYCLEKQIVFRSGRPSLIDDENISTPIPTNAPPGSSIDVETLTLVIRHAQISSQISRRIMSIKAPRQPVTQAMQTIQDIHEQLEKLLESIPPCLREKSYSSTARRNHSIYLHFAIWGSFMATHILFFYPWIAARYMHGPDPDPMIQEQMKRSSEVIANAARQIILLVRSTTTDANTPAWLAFYYPIYAHANLLVYILMDPSRDTTAADLALLDMCAGHFAFIELITDSEISFHFARDSVALCSKTVRAAAKNVDGDSANNITVPATPQATNGVGVGTGDSLVQLGDADTSIFDPPQPVPLTDMFDMDFDIDAFDIFSSIDICDDLVDPALAGLFD